MEGCYTATPTLGGRITRALFPRRHLPPLEEHQEAALAADGFVPGEMWTTTVVQLNWLDRLRALLSGKVVTSTRTATDVIVGKMRHRCTTYVLAPWESPREH